MSKIAIIVSQFNATITEPLLTSCVQRLKHHAIDEAWINITYVPGAIEIPLVAKKLANKRIYNVIIVLGCVIRGETSHYDYVCQQVSLGIQTVSLAAEIPIIFGVLTTQDYAQSYARIELGSQFADAAIYMADLMHRIDNN